MRQVGDLHRTLLYGGIFGYPADTKRPKGKLRLVNEIFPLSFLMEQAGGKASTGSGRLLDTVPQVPPSRPFLGSPVVCSQCIDRVRA
jgi:fructose-1,6-bisphosphatase I